MGKAAGGLVGALAFGVAGGFIGGLFSAGSFSLLGASVGFSVGGALFTPQPKFASGDNAPTIEDSAYDYPIAEFCGRVGSVRGNVVTVGKNDQGEYAGILVVNEKKDSGGCGSGSDYEEQSFYLIADFVLGRSMGGTLLSPDELFVDLIEVEDSDGRRAIYDRSGDTPEARGFELTPTVSGITGRVICETSDVLRLYTGTDEQMPDSALLEFYPEGLPAYRGVAHVVFNRLEVSSQPSLYFTVRSNLTNRRAVIEKRLNGVGIESQRLDLDAIPSDSVVVGKQVTGATPARETCEKLARREWCDFAFDGRRVRAIARREPVIIEVPRSAIGAWQGTPVGDEGEDRSGRLRLKARGGEEFCSIARASFVDRNQLYEAGAGLAVQQRATHANPLEWEMGEVATLPDATRVALALRDEDWAHDVDGELTLLPGWDDLMPGVVLRLPLDKQVAATDLVQAPLGNRDFLVVETRRETGGALGVQLVPYAGHVYEQDAAFSGPTQPDPRVATFAAPLLVVLDAPPLSASKPDTVSEPGLLVAVSQSATKKYAGARIKVGRPGNDDRWENQKFLGKATLGPLAAPYTPGLDATLTVEVLAGTLVSTTAQNAGRGHNLIGIETASGGLFVSFQTATVLNYDPATDVTTYELSGLDAGRFGSEYAAAGTLGAGTGWALVRGADGASAGGLFWAEIGAQEIGKEVTVKAIALGQSKNPPTSFRQLTFRARNVEPLAPVMEVAARETDGALRLVGRGRTRFIAVNTEPQMALHQQSEPLFALGFKYELILTAGGVTKTLTKYALDDFAAFDFSVSSAELATLFGSAPANLSGTVALWGHYGIGRKTQFEANQ